MTDKKKALEAAGAKTTDAKKILEQTLGQTPPVTSETQQLIKHNGEGETEPIPDMEAVRQLQESLKTQAEVILTKSEDIADLQKALEKEKAEHQETKLQLAGANHTIEVREDDIKALKGVVIDLQKQNANLKAAPPVTSTTTNATFTSDPNKEVTANGFSHDIIHATHKVTKEKKPFTRTQWEKYMKKDADGSRDGWREDIQTPPEVLALQNKNNESKSS